MSDPRDMLGQAMQLFTAALANMGHVPPPVTGSSRSEQATPTTSRASTAAPATVVQAIREASVSLGANSGEGSSNPIPSTSGNAPSFVSADHGVRAQLNSPRSGLLGTHVSTSRPAPSSDTKRAKRKTADQGDSVTREFFCQSDAIGSVKQWRVPGRQVCIQLGRSGLGLKMASFSANDSQERMAQILFLLFPALLSVGWGFCMGCVRRGGRNTFIDPVSSGPLSGLEIMQLMGYRGVIYIAPVQQNLQLAPPALSGQRVKCSECLMEVPTEHFMDHCAAHAFEKDDDAPVLPKRSCTAEGQRGQQGRNGVIATNDEIRQDIAGPSGVSTQASHGLPASSASDSDDDLSVLKPPTSTGTFLPQQENPEGRNTDLNGLLANFHQFVKDEHCLIPYSESSNTVYVTRGPELIYTALNAARSPTFRSRCNYPLKVVYLDEAGADGGGLRRDLLSHVLNHAESLLNNCEKWPLDEEANKDTCTNLAGCGLYCAIAMVQENIFPAFVLDAMRLYWSGSSTRFLQHFIEGLNELGVEEYFRDNVRSRELFKEDPFTARVFISFLDLPVLERAVKLKRAVTFFVQFLQRVEGEEVIVAFEDERPAMTVKLGDVLRYITGTERLPRGGNLGKIELHHVDVINYRPSVQTCIPSITFGTYHEYDEFEKLMAEAIQQRSFDML